MQLSDRIGRRIKLHDIHVLMAVAQAGSMNKAAALLNTTQSAISRSIADLESEIGAQLLDRTSQGVVPTACGRALLDGGAVLFDDLRQTVKSIEFLTDPTAGELRIGCNPFLAASLVSAVVERLSRRYPRIAFHVMAEQVDTLHRDLHERKVDLLIARKFGSLADEHLSFEFLFDDSFVVAAGARSPWARQRRIKLAELADELWTLPAGGEIASVARAAFRVHGLDYPCVTMATEFREARMNLLATGRFLTIFPASSLRFPPRPQEIKVLPVELSKVRMPIGIFTLKSRTLSPVAQLFLDCVREVAKPLANQA